MRFFCLSVSFLDPFFHGNADQTEVEWPPSPYRLLQAMLAGSLCGCRKSGWPDARADAFRWLEDISDAPLIITPKAVRASPYTLYVPKNDGDKVINRQDRLDIKPVRPSWMINGMTVRYLWGISDENWAEAEPHLKVLANESRNLLAFGWGIDVAFGDGKVLTEKELAALDGERWKPWEGTWLASGMRRVPATGSLEDLIKINETFLHSVQDIFRLRAKPRIFRKVLYLREGVLPPRPWIAFELRKPSGEWATFRHEDAARVGAMLRHITVESAKNDSYLFPGGWERYVAGRTSDRDDASPRFSYLPVPTTRHRHADGLIRRVLIAEPFGGNGGQVRWAAQRLVDSDLIDDAGEVLAELSRSQNPDVDRVLEAYVGRAKRWSSVTPVILPGFDDGNYEKARRLLFKAIAYSGLPVETMEHVILRKAPFWSGSQHHRLYYRPEYLRKYSAWHVHLRFKEEVYGPISVGSGRHIGLGLFVSDEARA